ALAGGLLEAFLQGVIDGLALLGIQADRIEIQFLADGFEAQALVLGRVFQGRDEVDARERLPSRAGHVQSVHYGARGQRFTGAGLQPEFLRDRLGDAWSIAVLEGLGEHPGGIYVWRYPGDRTPTRRGTHAEHLHGLARDRQVDGFIALCRLGELLQAEMSGRLR